MTMTVLIRRSGTLIDISPNGTDPLDSRIVDLLRPLLTYEHKTLLRGHKRYGPDGDQGSIDIELKHMYALEQGRLVTGFGFLTSISEILQRHGIQIRYVDISPAKRPDVYTPDWENCRRYVQFRAKQEECLHYITQNECGVIDATMGFGKAQPISSDVLTPTGWRKIGSLTVGDYVIGSDGKPTRVEAVHPQGVKRIAIIRFSDETVVRCCWEHLWSVQTASHRHLNQGFKTLTTEQISNDLGYLNGDSKWFVPLVEPIAFQNNDERLLHPYLLGCLIGDGCILHKTCLSNTDQWLLDEIARLIKPMGLVLYHNSAGDYTLTHRIKGLKNPVTDELRQLGLHGKGAHDKFIPASYKYAPYPVRLLLIQGLMDTDGTISDDHRRYAEFGPVASKQLAEDFCEMVRSIGGVTRVQPKVVDDDVYYRVRTNVRENLFRMPRKAELWNPDKKQGRSKAIRDIQPAGEADCVCIRVANADGLYVTEGYTVTHNTFLFEAMCHLYPKAYIDIVVKPTDVASRIVRQLSGSLPNIGQVGGKQNYYGDRITVYTAGSAHKSSHRADILLCDEAHLLMTEEASKALAENWRFSRNFAFTGTPKGRMDGADAQLELFFGRTIFKLSYQEAVSLGLVVPIHVRWLPIRMDYNPAKDKTGVPKMRWGIWRNQVRNQAIANDIRSNYPDPNTQILILVATVDHAIMLWQFLPEFALCYGNSLDQSDVERYQRNHYLPQNFIPTTPDVREQMRQAFEAGSLKRVIATDVWSTGVDFAQLQVLYRADARESENMDAQGPARVSRISPSTGKEVGEVVDCCDTFDKTFKRKSETRRRHYNALGWTQDWPGGRRQISVA